MYLLGVKKVQICHFKGTALATSCCTPKGTILNPYFSVCRAQLIHIFCSILSINYSIILSINDYISVMCFSHPVCCHLIVCSFCRNSGNTSSTSMSRMKNNDARGAVLLPSSRSWCDPVGCSAGFCCVLWPPFHLPAGLSWGHRQRLIIEPW